MIGRLVGWLAVMALLAAVVPARLGARAFAAPAGPRTLAHHVPAAVARGLARYVHHLPPSAALQITVGLPLRNGGALQRLLAEKVPGQAPLTLSEANAAFNPTAAQEGRVTVWLRS